MTVVKILRYMKRGFVGFDLTKLNMRLKLTINNYNKKKLDFGIQMQLYSKDVIIDDVDKNRTTLINPVLFVNKL